MTGGANIKIVGNTNQTITGSATAVIPAFEIASTGGTVTLAGTLNFLYLASNIFKYTSGTVDSGTSTVNFGCHYNATCTLIPGSILFNIVNISVESYNILNLTGTLNVNGNLTLSSNGNANMFGGTISASSNVSVTGFGIGGSTALTFTGNNSSTYTQNAGVAILSGLVTVNKTGGASLDLSTAASFNNSGQNFTLNSVTINMNNNNLLINSTLTLESGTTVNRGSGTLTYGSLVNNGGTIN